VVVCAEVAVAVEDLWEVTIAGAMVAGEMVAMDLQDHGEDTEEVTAVGAAAGVEMATAVVARWPEAAVAKEVAASEAVVDAEVAVHLTKTYFILPPNISRPPDAPQKNQNHTNPH